MFFYSTKCEKKKNRKPFCLGHFLEKKIENVFFSSAKLKWPLCQNSGHTPISVSWLQSLFVRLSFIQLILISPSLSCLIFPILLSHSSLIYLTVQHTPSLSLSLSLSLAFTPTHFSMLKATSKQVYEQQKNFTIRMFSTKKKWFSTD